MHNQKISESIYVYAVYNTLVVIHANITRHPTQKSRRYETP